MVRTRDRVIAIVIAVTFLATSVGLGILMVWDTARQKDRNQAAEAQLDTNTNSSAGKDMQDFTPVATVSELQIIDLKPGTGAEVKADSTLTVDYTGAIASTGKIFESSLDSGQQATFALQGTIRGWIEGLPGMKEGGVRRLLIPAEKAYGSSGNGSIPPNAALVFDVTVHKVQ